MKVVGCWCGSCEGVVLGIALLLSLVIAVTRLVHVTESLSSGHTWDCIHWTTAMIQNSGRDCAFADGGVDILGTLAVPFRVASRISQSAYHDVSW